MVFTVTNAISGITVESVSTGNDAGDALLTAKTADTLAWTAAGGTEGTPVEIANGETKVIADGDDATMYAVVSRTSASDLSGEATVTIAGFMSTHDRIVEVEAAITKVHKSQADGFGDARVQRATLSTLLKERADLYRQYLAETGTTSAAAIPDFRNL